MSEATFSKFMINLTQIYHKFRKKHIYDKFRSIFIINLSHIYHKFDFFRKHPTISNSSIFFDQQQQVGGGSFISSGFNVYSAAAQAASSIPNGFNCLYESKSLLSHKIKHSIIHSLIDSSKCIIL